MDAKNKITDIMLDTIILKKLKEDIDISSNSIQDTTFDVSYNGIVKQVSYTMNNDVKKSFSFTEPSSDDSSKKDFTVENIKNLFTKAQGGSKRYKKINLKLRKTTLKKKKGKKYNKKRYTMIKKSLTRNKNRTRNRSTKTKTKKQKRRIKKPRYTKRRY